MGKQLYRCSTSSNLGSVVKIYAKGVGADGADMTSVKGVTSIARTGEGTYTVTLDRKFKALLGCSATVIDAGSVSSWSVVLTSDLTSGNTFTLQVFSDAVEADVISTGTLLLEITLGDTTALPAR